MSFSPLCKNTSSKKITFLDFYNFTFLVNQKIIPQIKKDNFTNGVSNPMLFMMVFEANIMDTLGEWWVNNEATRHIYEN